MPSKRLIKKKSLILGIQKERLRVLQVFLSETELTEGSLTDLKVRCGHAGCHCTKTPAHPITRLGVREDGRIKNKVVRVADRDRVRCLVQTYQEHKHAMRELARINEKERGNLKGIIKLKNRRYA